MITEISQRLRVRITQDHIDNAKILSETKCPLALALNDRMESEKSFKSWIAWGMTFVRYENVYSFGRSWQLSKRAKQFINDFDRGLEVHPSTFELTRTK